MGNSIGFFRGLTPTDHVVVSPVADANGTRRLPVDVGSTTLANVTYVDQSVAAATGASQVLVAANAARDALQISNPIGGTDWVINPVGGVAAIGTPVCFTLRPGDTWSPVPCPANAITGIGTAAATLSIVEG